MSDGDDRSGPTTRFEHAYEELRSLLLSGRLAPGTRLTEAELTRMLGVSRSTIRAALVRLSQQGYVTYEPNRGVRTRRFSVAEAIDILEAREVIEAALAAGAAEHATAEEIERLRETVAALAGAARDGAREAYTEHNRSFHRQVRDAARQPTLAGFLDALVYPLVLRQYRDLERPHPRPESVDEHQAILSAIVTRNAAAADAAMRHHVAAARRALLLAHADHH